MSTMYKSLTATDRRETGFLYQKLSYPGKQTDHKQINEDQFSDCRNNRRVDTVAHSSQPTTQDEATGSTEIQGQPELQETSKTIQPQHLRVWIRNSRSSSTTQEA